MPDPGPRSHFKLFTQEMVIIGDLTDDEIGDIHPCSGSVAYSRFLREKS